MACLYEKKEKPQTGGSASHPEDSVAMVVELTFGAVRMAASAVRGIAELMLDQEQGQQLEVVVAEVGNNIILHGMGDMQNPPGHTFTITVTGRDGKLTLIFEDEGPPFDLAAARPGTPEESVAQGGGGLGIFIVRQVMDELSYTRKGTRNRLTLVKYGAPAEDAS